MDGVGFASLALHESRETGSSRLRGGQMAKGRSKSHPGLNLQEALHQAKQLYDAEGEDLRSSEEGGLQSLGIWRKE